jgi:hypothetical protein
MRFLVAVVVLGTPCLALAQALSVTLDGTTMDQSVGTGDCGNSHTVEWTGSIATTDEACSPLYIWLTPNNCEEVPDGGGGEIIVGQVTDNTNDPTNWMVTGTGSVSFTTAQLPTSLAGQTVCEPGVDVDIIYNVCATFAYAPMTTGCVNTTTTNIIYQPQTPTDPDITFEFDDLPPPAPSYGLSPGDTTVTASANDYWPDGGYDTATTEMDLFYLAVDADAGCPANNSSGTYLQGSQSATTYAGDAVATGLTDGQLYAFYMTATSPGGVSGPSGVQCATPVLTQGFFGYYLDSGGAERGGGCATAAGLAPWLVLVASRLLRRRRH